MKRCWAVGVVGAVAVLGATFCVGEAQAQSWAGASDGAQQIESGRGLAGVLWASIVDCSRTGSDLERRQCQGIKSAQTERLAGAAFEVRGDGTSLVVGDYDAKKKQLVLSVKSCIACAKPVDVSGAKVEVRGEARDLASVSVPLRNAAAAMKWKSKVAPRLRAQMIVKLGAAPKVKSRDGSMTALVKVVAFRVYDPCDGKIYAAKPKSSSVTADKRYCSGEPVKDLPKTTKQQEPVAPTLPSRLSPNQIRDGLSGARAAARKCFEAYGVPGTARFRITISGDGEVVGVRERGDFVGTPTSTCIRKAVKQSSFPKTRRARTSIDYPFVLR